MSDLDSLLDATLDDLADLPSFKPFPTGAHKVSASLDFKEINKKPAVEASFIHMETLELSNPEDVPPVAGDKANTLFMLDNEIGQGKFKAIAKIFSEALGITGSIRDVIDAVTNVECAIITTVVQDDKDKDRYYMNVKELSVL